MTDLEKGIQALNLQLANLADDIILKDLKPRWDAIPEFDQKHLYDSDVKLWIACLRKERERLQSLLVQLLQCLQVVQAVPTPPITNKGWSVDELSSDQVMHNLSSLFDILLPESTIPAYVQLNTKVVGNTEVPFFLNQPTLLFWNLGFLNIDDLLSQCLAQRRTIMVGTSGTGKTRDIFEILTQRFGLFFTVQDNVIPGSPDFTNVLQRFQHHLTSNPLHNQMCLSRFIGCLVSARLWVFQRLAHLNLTPLQWLILQLKFDFTPLVNEFCALSERRLKRNLVVLMANMASKNLEVLQSKTIEHVLVFLDEAQATIEMNINKFPSSENEASKPLYYGLTVGFLEISGCSFVSCGTGLKLDEAYSLILSRAAKPNVDIKFIISNTFDSAAAVQDFVGEFFPNDPISTEDASWFIGRVRFLTSFVEFQVRCFLLQKPLLLVAEYVSMVTSSDTFELTLKRLFDSTRFNKEIYPDCLQLLKDSVLFHIYFGMPMVVTITQAWLFEKSFGRLEKDHELSISLDEPLILATAKELLMTEPEKYAGIPISELITQFESRICQGLSPSTQGLFWENYLVRQIIKLCQEDCRFLFGANAADYHDPGLLVNPTKDYLVTQGKNCTFASYLINQPSAFYFPDTHAGPNIVFFLNMSGNKIPVFIQCKFQTHISCNASLKTTNPQYFYCNPKTHQVLKNSEKDYAEVQAALQNFPIHLGVFIAFPKQWKKNMSSKQNGRYEHLIDANNINIILDQDHISLLQHIKK